MTQIATVEKLIDAQYAEISVPRESACGHDCAGCGGCGMIAQSVHAVAKNLVGARPGDKVVVESSTKKVLSIVVLVYVVPFVCFFLGYAFSASFLGFKDGISGLLGFLCFLIGVVPALLYNRHVKMSGSLQYSIVRLFQRGD